MAAPKRKGLTDGVTTEFTVIGKITPGHEKALREYAEANRDTRNPGLVNIGTVHEWKALEVQKAFQQVLDTAGAEKALANPVLKPLLDLAAR